MSNRRTVALIGAVVAVVGVAGALAPGLAAALPVPSVPVALLGGAAALVLLVVVGRRRNADFRAADPPEVEDAVEHPTPGAAFDDQLAGAGGIGVDAAQLRRESREHLHDVAVDVLVATDGRSREDAERALADGTWTDDPVAAQYFATDGAVTVDRPLRDRLRAVFSAPQSRREMVARTVAELARRTGRDEQ